MLDTDAEYISYSDTLFYRFYKLDQVGVLVFSEADLIAFVCLGVPSVLYLAAGGGLPFRY